MRTVLLAIILAFYLVLAIPYQLILLLIRLFNKDFSMTLSYGFLKHLSKVLFAFAGTRLHIEGIENMNTDNYLVVANHRSLLDTPLILALSSSPLALVGKEELLKVPFINLWMYLLGGLFLDRRSLRKGYNTIMEGVERLKAGGNMAIFPQGTRNKGDEFLPFKAGSFKLATLSKAKIIPIAHFGTDKALEESKAVRPTDVYVKIFEPIDTKDFTEEEIKGISKKIEKMIYNEYMKFKEQTL